MERAEVRSHGAIATAVEIVEAGLVAGVAAGSAMATWLAVYALATGIGLLTPFKLIGATFYGAGALQPGYGPVFWGLAIHYAVAMAFGVLYAAIVRRDAEPLASVAGAIAYAFAIWAVMTFAVLPVVDPVMRDHVSSMSLGWFGSHVAYGAVLGVVPQARRRFGGA